MVTQQLSPEELKAVEQIQKLLNLAAKNTSQAEAASAAAKAQERLSLFAGVQVQVVRLALNHDQVEQYQPPPNPARLSDSRAADYISKYGDSSWELDALEPAVIAQLIRESVLKCRDQVRWDAALALEASHKDTMQLWLDGIGPWGQEEISNG